MAFCFLKTEEEASSTIVWSRDQSDRKQAAHQANIRHFELSRKRIAARMRTCQCMSHFVYDLRSRPLVRDKTARVRGQIASDHCRSDLITGRTHWARAGCPFPEVNLVYLRREPADNPGSVVGHRTARRNPSTLHAIPEIPGERERERDRAWASLAVERTLGGLVGR